MKYTCAMCGSIYESQWTEAEALAELKRDFGDVPLDQCDQVCDDCYQQISPTNNPEAYNDYLQATVADESIRVSVPVSKALMESMSAEMIRRYVDTELSRRIGEEFDRYEAEILFGVSLN